MNNQGFADTIALLILVAGLVLGYSGAGWFWTPALALVGTVAFLLLKKEAHPSIITIDRLGPMGMFILQTLNALGLYGLGVLLRWAIH